MAAQAEVSQVLRHLHNLTPEAEGLSDRQLLERFVGSGEEEAFAALVRRHGGMVLGLCRRLLGQQQDAEDVFQAAFFILARKAVSIRRATSLAAWLYGVAYRLALKARAASARRRDRESHGAATTPADPTSEVASRELRLVLDEELRQLPDGYRAALVLCYLENRTQEQAARQLGWSKGTLRRRLVRGRELLRQRLLRQGVAPAVVLAVTLTNRAGPAAVSAEWAAATARAALRYAGSNAAMTLSTRPAALALGGLSSGRIGQLKAATALLLVLSLAAAGLWAGRASTPSDQVANKPQPATSRKPTTDARQETADTIEVSGRVLDPAGKPVAGSHVYCFRSNLMHLGDGGVLQGAPHGKPTGTTSGPDGRFRFRVRKANHHIRDEAGSRFEATVAAVAPGHGPGWKWVGRPEGLNDLTLRLVRDEVPIRGRVVSLEGKPIKGVSVRVVAIIASDKEDLKPFVNSLQQKKRAASFWQHLSRSVDPALIGLPYEATTDADGRFLLRGFGRERVVALRFEEASVETQVEYAMTRPGATVRTRGDRKGAGRFVLHGASFERVAAPTQLVAGTVRDRDTGKPLAGVKIAGFADLSTLNKIHTTTDKAGHYRLSGLPRGGAQRIFATVPEGQPYLSAVEHTRPGPGFDPIRLDFGLKRGVLIRGRVTDGETGKPVSARVHYFAFSDNPNLQNVPSFRGSSGSATLTRPDGSFVIVGLPGRGLIAARALHDPGDRYLAGAGADKIKGARDDRFATDPYYCSVTLHNSLTEVNPAATAQSVTCNVTLRVGKTVTGSIVGPDGKPVKGVRIEGALATTLRSQAGPLPTDRFRLAGIDPTNPRPFFFLHETKQLGAAVVLTGKEPKAFVVRLRPCGTLRGRLLDGDGQPVPGARLLLFAESGQLGLKGAWGLTDTTTDKEGRFRMPVIAGVQWGAHAQKGGALAGKSFEKVLLSPGAVKDLGDITIKAGQ